MSRYIDADAVITAIAEFNKYEDELEYPYASDDLEEYKDDARLLIEDAPSIDLDDYVPKDFHDKTCEAMAKRHQEEITDLVSVEDYRSMMNTCYKLQKALEDTVDMVRVVRCKECYMCDEEMWCSFYDSIMESDDFCSYGERKSDE